VCACVCARARGCGRTSMMVTLLVSMRSKSVGRKGPGVQVRVRREATSACVSVSTCATIKSIESAMAASRSPSGNCCSMYFCNKKLGMYGNLAEPVRVPQTQE